MNPILPYVDRNTPPPTRQIRLPLLSLLCAIVSGPVGLGFFLLGLLGPFGRLNGLLAVTLLAGALLTPILLSHFALAAAATAVHPRRAQKCATAAIIIALLWIVVSLIFAFLALHD